MQTVIREEFGETTNITIAHRLGESRSHLLSTLTSDLDDLAESIIDFDKVLVLEGGKLVEFDTPRKLLQNKSSKFHELCEATGSLEELKKRVK